jgi:hypothetical protein
MVESIGRSVLYVKTILAAKCCVWSMTEEGMYRDVRPLLLIELSRVDRFLPIRQVDVCFLRLPPGCPAVPQYLNHVSVGPSPSQNRTCGFAASGSSSRFTACLLIVELVSVTMFSPGSVSRIVSPHRYACLSTPSLHRHYPASTVL